MKPINYQNLVQSRQTAYVGECLLSTTNGERINISYYTPIYTVPYMYRDVSIADKTVWQIIRELQQAVNCISRYCGVRGGNVRPIFYRLCLEALRNRTDNFTGFLTRKIKKLNNNKKINNVILI